MSIIKYLKRLKRMDDLIRRESTGTPEEFAEKLGICKSMLMYNLSEIREIGAPIKYDASKPSYYYSEHYRFQLNNEIY